MLLLLPLLQEGGAATTTTLLGTMLVGMVLVLDMPGGVQAGLGGLGVLGATTTYFPPASSSSSSGEETSPEPPPQPQEHPSIEDTEPRNVTAVVGTTALLSCRVRNVGTKTVSWIRHRDLHLLAVGQFTYTTDQRFVAVHAADSDRWLLKIRYIQPRDAGMYECQISTTPPSTHLIHLTVVEPETVIVGGPDVYINVGSRLVLTCLVKFTPEPPAFIFWYHDDKLVSYERTRGGGRSSSSSSSSGGNDLEVSTERGEVTTSSLLVQAARQSHSGRYMCTPANSKVASVNVHVLQGDRPEAIVHDNAPTTLTLHPYLHLLPILFLLLLLLPVPSSPFTPSWSLPVPSRPITH